MGGTERERRRQGFEREKKDEKRDRSGREKEREKQDLVDALQYIWRQFAVILNRKWVAQTIYDYITNELARAK